MADTTKDIWNDSDEGESPEGRGHRFKGFLIFFVTLVLVLAVVLIAAYRDGTGFDVLHRYLSHGSAAVGEVSFSYDASASNRFAMLDGGLVVLSETALKVLGADGKEVWSANVKMTAPALVSGGGRVAAYDVGGTELYVVSAKGEELSMTVDEDEALIAANLNKNGYLAVTAEKKNYKGCVSVYNREMKLIYAFNSSQRFVTDACVTDDNAMLAAVTVGQEDSVFVSNVVLYDLSETTPQNDYSLPNSLVLEIGEQQNRLVTVSDTCLTFSDSEGKSQVSYDYSDAYLREYDTGDADFTALLLNRYQAGSVGRLVTVDAQGQEIASLPIQREVMSLSSAGRYLAVLYMDELVIYNRELQEYASIPDMETANQAVMCEDGTVLVITAESAHLLFP